MWLPPWAGAQLRSIDARTTSGSAEDAQVLAGWLGARLARNVWPRFIEFNSALPRTASGKLEKLGLIDSAPPPGHWDRLAAASGATPPQYEEIIHAK